VAQIVERFGVLDVLEAHAGRARVGEMMERESAGRFFGAAGREVGGQMHLASITC
jgi:hypothetical protein